MLLTEEPDEDEEEENSEESLEDESEEEVTETPESPSSSSSVVCVFPPPPVWVQCNQGLSRPRPFPGKIKLSFSSNNPDKCVGVSYSAELVGAD